MSFYLSECILIYESFELEKSDKNTKKEHHFLCRYSISYGCFVIVEFENKLFIINIIKLLFV